MIENLLIAAAAAQRPHLVVRGRCTICPSVPKWRRCSISSASATWPTSKAGELPEGKRKLADIAVALALKPRLLLMDEPTSGVASSEKFAIMDILVAALAQKRVTSVFVEHDMDMVTRYADRVAVWNAGQDPDDRTSGRRCWPTTSVREQVIGI